MKIIAVDDEKIALQGLLSSINSAAPTARVYGFRYASEAIAHMENDPCDIAFLDIEMKGVDGITTAQKLKEINPDVNIIFATGFGSYRGTAFDLHASGYLIKPITPEGVKRELDNLRRPIRVPKKLKAIAFGNFQILYGEEHVKFKYQKTNEMLAYLIDRRGSMCSANELMSVLFEDDTHQKYYNQLRLDLIGTLKSLGCESVIVQTRGMLGVSVSELECDYFDYLNGKAELANLYHGEYMAQYSFAELTNASLFAKLTSSSNK
ncbi:MAG: response regulator [Proteobacteria bacterium]|nr:response regulator [Pseudomonadota bacterium]